MFLWGFYVFCCLNARKLGEERKNGGRGGGGGIFHSCLNICMVKKQKMHKTPTEKLATQAKSKKESNGQESSSTSPNKQSSSQWFCQQLIASTNVAVSTKHYQDIPRRNRTKTYRYMYTLPNTLYSSIDRLYVYFIM